MRGKRTIWTRVRSLETERVFTGWTGPMPIVCPHHWPADDFAAWNAAQEAGDEAALDALIGRHAGVRPLPPDAGIRCIVIRHLLPREWTRLVPLSGRPRNIRDVSRRLLATNCPPSLILIKLIPDLHEIAEAHAGQPNIGAERSQRIQRLGSIGNPGAIADWSSRTGWDPLL
jgi:hypothetical protein